MGWTAVQIGRREYYRIPRSLARLGLLDKFVTDLALSEGGIISSLVYGRVKEERMVGIPGRLLLDNKLMFIRHYASVSRSKEMGWRRGIDYNNRFGKWASSKVDDTSKIVFSYSYSALKIFEVAKKLGKKCVLGQIDPGPLEWDIVKEYTRQYREIMIGDIRPPWLYWDQWRQEIESSDIVLSNSEWSSSLLKKAGVPNEKIMEVPLTLDKRSSNDQKRADRIFHTQSESQSRRKESLNVLFLGALTLRKGIGQIFDAIRLVEKENIYFNLAGPICVKIPSYIGSNPKVNILGAVGKKQCEQLYSSNDVFLFPTLSDGFGITQLEAMSYGLPVIASMNCATVVKDMINGILLKVVTPESIADSLKILLDDNIIFSKLKSNAFVDEKYHQENLDLHLSFVNRALIGGY